MSRKRLVQLPFHLYFIQLRQQWILYLNHLIVILARVYESLVEFEESMALANPKARVRIRDPSFLTS